MCSADETICRLCGDLNRDKEPGSSITADIFSVDGLVDLIFKYLSITIREEDSLPHCVCTACKRQIECFNQYAIQCQNIQDTLLQENKKVLLESDFTSDLQSKGSQDVKFIQENEIKQEETDIDNTLEDSKNDLEFCDEDFIPLSQSNRPDIVLVDHNKNTTYIVDVTIPHDENLQKAERDKILKYMDLAHEIKDMWRTPATIVGPIVISTNGLIPKSLHANLCKVGVDGGLKYLMQKAVLLSTCRTLRKIVLNDCPKSADKSIKTERKPKKTKIINNKSTKRKTTKCNKVSNQKGKISNQKGDKKNGVEDEIKVEVDTLDKLFDSYIRYNCHRCQIEFNNWDNLEVHVKVNHAEKPRVLCICSKRLYSVNVIRAHINRHGEIPSSFKCDKCDKVFLKKSNFDRHLLKHNRSKQDKKVYECKECFRIFRSSASYDRHAVIHHGNRDILKKKCELCNRFFAGEQSLKMHTEAVHDKYRPYVCDICGHAFYQKKNLESHRESHGDRVTLQCELCPRKFLNERYFKQHLRIHQGECHKCPVCPTVFNHKKTLNNHMYTHQNVYRYVCGFCNKGFKWQSSLKTHINIHTGATPYTCPWCSRSFSDRSNCRLHKRKHHPKELAEYEKKNGIVHLGKTMAISRKDPSVASLRDPSKVKIFVYPKVNIPENGEE